MQGISWLSEQLLVSQKGLCFMGYWTYKLVKFRRVYSLVAGVLRRLLKRYGVISVKVAVVGWNCKGHVFLTCKHWMWALLARNVSGAVRWRPSQVTWSSSHFLICEWHSLFCSPIKWDPFDVLSLFSFHGVNPYLLWLRSTSETINVLGVWWTSWSGDRLIAWLFHGTAIP